MGKQWQTLFSWASKSLQMVTAAMKLKDACSLEEDMTDRDSTLKNVDINLLTKVCLAKVMDFPAVMYGYDSWTIKKVEHWRIDAFELWCWRRLLRDHWDCKEINPWKDWCWSWSPILWPPDAKSWFIRKDTDSVKVEWRGG